MDATWTDMLLVLHILAVAFVRGTAALSLPGQNTPPVLTLNRNWKLPENEIIGSRIETARAQDAEDNELTFDIKPSEFIDGSRFFRVDPQSGDIYLNSSLQGEAGAQYYLYVTANDGEFESKTEVFVEILSPTSSASGGKRRLSTARPLTVPPVVTSRIIPRPSAGFFPATSSSSSSSTLRSVDTMIVQGGVSNVVNTANGGVADEMGALGNDSDEDDDILARPKVSSDLDSDDDENAHHAVLAVLVVALTCMIPLTVVSVWFVRQLRRKDSDVNPDKKKRDERAVTTLSPTAPIRMLNLQECEMVTSSVQRAQSNKYETAEWEGPEIKSREPVNGDQKDGGVFTINSSGTWEYPRHRLKIFGILGEGCFGQVWKCEAQDLGGLPGTTIVAVKTLKEHAGEREKKDLVSELEVMKMLDPHPNIVRLLGCCTEKDPLFVLMEYVPHGKLQTYLRNSRAEHYYGNLHGSSQHLTSSDLTAFAHHVARGMQYLASKGIIHRDLAARNVLVGHNKTCKVADFGFARDVIANRVYERKSEGRLPIRWMAPESLYDNIFSSKTDVWSFGVLLWEIVTLGSTPYPGMAASDVIKKVRDGYRLEKPDHCKRELYNIMFYCWDKDSRIRPSFTELAQTLENLLLGDIEYIELERFPEHAYYNVVSLSGEKL